MYTWKSDSKWLNMLFLFYSVVIYCFCLYGVYAQASPCTTPNGERAECKRIRSCPILKDALFSEDSLVKKFIDDSISSCGSTGSMICCGTSSSYIKKSNKPKETVNPPPPSKREYAIKHLLPNRRICGMQHTDDYFYNDTRTSVDEFPWLLGVYYDNKRNKRSRVRRAFCPGASPSPALLLALKGSLVGRKRRDVCIGFGGGGYVPTVTYRCTGVLISNRYALTHGSCGTDAPMLLTLGQYERNKTVSCIQTSFNEDDCTHPAINVTVEERIRSPNNSITLLRLEKKIQYNDFIRPICLPMDESIRPKIGDMILSSGWVYEGTDDQNVTAVKGRIKQKIVSNEECEEEPSSGHLCSMMLSKGLHICKSDSGGPFMNRYKYQNWYVEGLIDVNRCFNDTIRGVRITPQLVDWILENMRD